GPGAVAAAELALPVAQDDRLGVAEPRVGDRVVVGPQDQGLTDRSFVQGTNDQGLSARREAGLGLAAAVAGEVEERVDARRVWIGRVGDGEAGEVDRAGPEVL